MYSNRRSKVGTKSSSPIHDNGEQEDVSSSLGLFNSILPGETMCHHVAEGDMPSSEACAFTGHEDISGGQQMVSSATGSILRNSHVGAKMFHRVLAGDVQGNEDSDFREHDNVSQHSNKSGSYVEVNPAKAGSFENVAYLSQTAEDLRSQLGESRDNNDEALKAELLDIFEMYFKNKMEERLRAFKSREMEWEEVSRAEKEELGNKMAREKMEMQKHFADAISKLTHSFNEERKQLEQCHEEQLKDLRKKLGTGPEQVDGKYVKDDLELKEKLGDEHQEMLMKETSHEKQEVLREKSEIKARFNKEKFELEKNFNSLLTEAEASLHKVRTELKESLQMEKENQKKIIDLESKLKDEKQQRIDVERELEQEKKRYSSEESLNKKEHEQLRSNVDELRKEIEEKNSEMKRLLEANQESNLKIRALTRHLQKRVKRNSEGGSVRSHDCEEAREGEGHTTAEGSSNSARTNGSDLPGRLRDVETSPVDTENTIVKVYNSKMRLIDERRKILVFVTFEKRPEQGLYRFLNALLPKQPKSCTVRVLMTSDSKNEEVFSEH
ncbi:hypothetical protein ACROYT_G002084 [Oculina patagonica]